MTNRKQLALSILMTSFLASMLFTVIPTRSQPGTNQVGTMSNGNYDPWIDSNDDGVIDIFDLVKLATSFNAEGTPINKTAMLIDLQNKITELENRVKILENLHGYQYPPINSDWFNGLVGYWKLDEGSGNVTADSSGNNNNGTLENGASWVAGKYGFAVGFDGINDRVTIPDTPGLRLQTFTLEAWVYMTKRPYQQEAPNGAIINKLHYLGSGYNGYKLQFEGPTSTNDHLVLSIANGGAQTFLIEYNSFNDLTLNTWHQIVGTYDGTTASIYVDGILRSYSIVGNHVIGNDEGPLVLGNEYYVDVCQFEGLIDTAMIYNRSLTSGEVLAHYAFPPP